MLRLIGIDFGTSSTYMNVKRYDKDNLTKDSFNYIPVAFEHGESKGTLVSVIRENADGSFDFGRVANEEADGATIYRNFKMDLESPEKGKREKSRMLVKKLFEYLYNIYRQQITQLGDENDEEETIVSYPVKWQENTVNFMLDVAKEAGFKNVRGMDEATAAISTVLSREFDSFVNSKTISFTEPGYLMLIDMGAGTTDLALCKYSFDTSNDEKISGDSMKIEIVTPWPLNEDDPTFGGREIDEVLMDYVENFLMSALPAEQQKYASTIVRIGNNIKLWKENSVSPNINASKPITVCGFIRPYMVMTHKKFPPITKESFEEMVSEELKDYIYLIEGCLEKAGSLEPDFVSKGLDMVILAGGHSSWYFSKDIIDGTMPGLEHPSLRKIREDKSRVYRFSNPQSTVALGLVYNKLLSSLNLSRPKSIDDSWIKHLYNAPLNPEFGAPQYEQEQYSEIYASVIDFTQNVYRFPTDEAVQSCISVFESNKRCLDAFRYKEFFGNKNKNICFCAEKGKGGAGGFALSAYGIYFESRFSNGCVDWQSFLTMPISLTGWNKDKVTIGTTIIPVNRILLNIAMDYFIRLQEYLRQRFLNQ